MVTTVATLLIVFAALDGPGPIAASMARHAADLFVVETFTPAADATVSAPASRTASIARHASEPLAVSSSADAQWRRVAKIPPATSIVVDAEAVTVAGIFATADAAEITVLDVEGCGLTREGRRVVERLVAEMPDAMSRFPGGLTSGDVSIRGDGVFISGTRVCAQEALVRRVDRRDVRRVIARTTRSSTAGVSAAAAGGLLAGLYLAATTSLDCRDRGCAARAFGLMAGVPVGAALAVHAATQHTVEEVYYRRD